MDQIVRVLSLPEVKKAIAALPKNMTIGLLFSGDRLTCIDEGVAIYQDKHLAGLATIAPSGEQLSGTPAIVGFYVCPEFRRQGVGKKLIDATVDRCIERGWQQVKVDAVSEGMLRVVDSLGSEKRKVLQVTDWSMCYVPLE